MAGRPTEYKSEYVLKIKKLLKLGATDFDVADFFNINESTLNIWKSKYPEIKALFDSRQELMELRAQEREEVRAKRRQKRAQPHIRKSDNEYLKRVLKENPQKRLRHNFAAQLRQHLKSKNGNHVFDLVGYSVEELRAHLESQFKPGMNWGNYGTHWHIDHKKPVSWFQYSSSTDQSFIECWSLNNLQPLEKHLNLSKSNRYASA